MQADIDQLLKFTAINKLKINPTKSNYLLFSKLAKCCDSFRLQCSADELVRVKTLRYLGLLIDENLNWSDHVKSVISVVAPFVGALYRIGNMISLNLKLKLYFAHIHSRLLYLNAIWSGASSNLLSQVKKLQNKALKTIYKLPVRTPTINLYNNRLLPFSTLCEFNIIILVKSILCNTIRHTITIIENNDIHQYSTRTGGNLHMSGITTTRFGKKSILHRGLIIYNSLPKALTNIESISRFKFLLKEHLFEKFCESYLLTH